jgi:UDP-N-acetylglucosamine 3-dehydrogenase
MTVRVALVGCGAAARRLHLRGLRAAGAEVVAFSSRTRESAEEAAAAWGAGEVVDDWREAVVRPDVDAVDVCSPNDTHAEIAIAAASAGKHVLVEKPMARNVGEADRMMDTARRSGVTLMPAHNVRFLEPFAAMRDAVAQGDVGQVRAFRCAWGHTGPQDWAPGAGWFRRTEVAGGGALIDLGVHAADLLRSVLNDDATAVGALVSTGSGPGDSGSDWPQVVEDLAELVVRFSGGAIGTLQASWALAAGSDHQLTIQGTRGTLHLDHRTPPTLLKRGGGDAVRVPVPAGAPSLFEHFVAVVEGRGEPAVTAADGRAAVALVEAAYRSARSGHVEPVEAAGATAR